MRSSTIIIACLWVLGLTSMGSVLGADNDARNSREREMLRRAQEALRQSQMDNSALAQGKAEAEQKLKAAAEQIEATRNSTRSERATLSAQLKSARDEQSATAAKLEEANRQIAALKATQQQTASQLSTSEAQLKQVRQDLESSQTAGASCEAKNLQLYEYSQELARRYRNKGVWAALSQKDPVLGFGQVHTDNVLQEYQDKLDSQRVQRPQTH